jgi:transcriptional regulator with XRE-family HTH domain
VVNIKALDPDSGPEAAYGARLRRVRQERGWNQDDLATRTGYSSKHISAVETARRTSTLGFSRALDAAFGLTNTAESFEHEWRKLRHGLLLEGFPEYVHQERRAVEIRLYEVGVIPGLLQTPEYATTLEAGMVERGAVTQDQADARVELVSQRQASLVRTPPPLVFVVLDESCVRRPVGSRSAVAAQLEALLDFAKKPTTVLQIAPFTMGERRPLTLPITVLTMPDRSLMAYAESSQRGHLDRESSSIVPILTAYHQLQAEALSQSASVAMINEVRKGMT